MERKYQVFISSTFKDLAEHRQAAQSAIIRAGHLPIALENFSPDSKAKAEVIRTAIHACQFFVLILGHRYGYRPKQNDGTPGPSYVEIELNWAQEVGLPIIPFLLDEDIVRKKRETLSGPNALDELNNENEYWELRKRFIEITDPFFKPFSSPNEIYSELYAYFSRSHKVSGYIFERKDIDAGKVLKIYTSNEVLQAVVSRFGEFKMVENRLSDGTAQKEALSNAFDDLHGNDIEHHKYSKIFFESGSTLIYLAKRLAYRLPKRLYTGNERTVPKILTNNALAYVYLWLCESIMCHPKPEGPPDEKYGGMYGPLAEYQKFPDYRLRGLYKVDPEAAKLIESLSNEIFGSSRENSRTLILAAMSGLQLSKEIKLVYKNRQPIDKNNLAYQMLKGICGFHVGSYRNRLFKRCMYLSKAPTIFFIHDEKIDCEIVADKCHFIFDREYSWDTFIEEHPISIWIGCTQKTFKNVLDKCQSSITKGHWKFTIYGEANENPVVIGYNERFRTACSEIDVRPIE